MPVTIATGPQQPEHSQLVSEKTTYADRLSEASHLLPKQPAAGTTSPGPAFRGPVDAAGVSVDSLPPLPELKDVDLHTITERFTQAALADAGLTSSREVDELAERQLLWRLMNKVPEQAYLLDEGIPDDVFFGPLRVTLLGYLRELYHYQGTVTAQAVWQLVQERGAASIHREGLERECLLVFQASNGRPLEEILDGLRKTFRARAISQLIFQSAAQRYERGEDIDTLINGIEQVVIELSQKGKKRRSFGEVVRAVHKQILDPDKTRQGLSLGLRDFDRQFGGLKRDRVLTIGGYTGSGKTALLIDLIYRLLFYHKEKIAIKFFSFEMSEERIVQRLFSRAAQVSVKRQDDWWVKVRYDRDDEGNEVEVELMEPLTEDEIRRINAALPFLESMEGVIDVEYSAYSIEEAQRECRRHALLNKGKHLIYLFDHIGLIKKDGGDNRVQFDNIMNGCKDIARSLDATVIPLVQLAKTVESRFNKVEYFRPTSSDIMESVGVEAASDIVLLLWRPSKFFESIPYIHPDLGIFTSDEDPKDEWWDCRHRMIAVNVKNRDGASFNDIVFDADMAHSKLYNYDQLRRQQPELFGRKGTLFSRESYLTGETEGSSDVQGIRFGNAPLPQAQMLKPAPDEPLPF